jgi:hypothetical protein
MGAPNRAIIPSQHLVDGALEAVHGVHHEMNGGVQKLLRRLGVEPLDEPGGVLDVGKEDGDLLALAFKAGTRGENFLGQVCRRVVEWRPLLWRCRDRGSG